MYTGDPEHFGRTYWQGLEKGDHTPDSIGAAVLDLEMQVDALQFRVKGLTNELEELLLHFGVNPSDIEPVDFSGREAA